MIDPTLGGIIPDYTFIFIGIIFISFISAYALTSRWIVRVLIGAYIALVLTMVLPDKMIFTEYAELGFLLFLIVLFTMALGSRIINMTSWSEGRFPWRSIIFSFFTVTFLSAIMLMFMPALDVPSIIGVQTMSILTGELWFFIWAAAPATFLLIFAPRY